MKKKARILALILTVAMVFSFTACSDTVPSQPMAAFVSEDDLKIQTLVLVGTPYEIGRQYGEQAKALVTEIITEYETTSMPKLTQKQKDDAMSAFKDTCAKYVPDLPEQVRGLADGAGLKYETVLMYNSRSYVNTASNEGCTTLLATGTATNDGKVYLQKNRDAGRGNQIMVQVQSTTGYRYQGIMLPGSFSMAMGINEKGVAIGNNAISTWDVSIQGFDNMLMHTVVLQQAGSAREAAELIEKLPRMGGATYPIADKTEAVFLEASASATAEIWVANDAVAHTNHFIHPDMLQYNKGTASKSSIDRLARATELLQHDMGLFNIHRFLAISEDRTGSDPNSWIDRAPGATVGTVSCGTFNCTDGIMWVQDGQPRETQEVIFNIANLKFYKLQKNNFVPLQSSMEAKGAVVKYNDSNPQDPVAEITKGTNTLKLSVNKNTAVLNGKATTFKGLTVFSEGKLFVPQEVVDMIK